MKTTKLTKKQIRDLPEFLESDKAETDLLIKLALQMNYRIDPRLDEIYAIHPLMWKYNWNPLQGVFTHGRSKGKTKVPVIEIYHALMHSLVARRYGTHQVGKPLLCFFSEALASALDLYFALKLTNTIGHERAKKATLLHLYSRNSYETGEAFVKKFTKLQNDPFASYRQLVLHLIGLMKDLSTINELNHNGDPVGATLKVLNGHKRSPLRPFAHQYDIPNFVLYTKAYCGSKSSTQDKKDFADGLRKLHHANSFSDFVLSLA